MICNMFVLLPGLPADNVDDAHDTSTEQPRTMSGPEAVVTQILAPASGIS